MKQVVIENPVINSPFTEPGRHFKFDDDGITDQIVTPRRVSCYFIPIAQPRKKAKDKQQTIEGWTADRIEENKLVNQIRQRVAVWRGRGYPDLTRTSRLLLDYWQSPLRNRRLFFCQVEALETALYLTEAAARSNDRWLENKLREESETANPGLYRIALKLATGTGKTVVMAMLIAWHSLNKTANPQDARFSDAFLITTPGMRRMPGQNQTRRSQA